MMPSIFPVQVHLVTYQFNGSQPPHLPLPEAALMEFIFAMCFLFNIVTNLNNNIGKVVKIGIQHHKHLSTPWGNMAINTSDIVYLSNSDDSDFQSEVWNVAQQVIHFVDNNLPPSDNESLNNDSSDNKSDYSENGQNGKGNFMQIPITNYEWDTEPETYFEMGWEWTINSYPWPSVVPFLAEEVLLMDPEENEPYYFFEAFFESMMWNHIAHKSNRYAETRITQRCK